MSSNAYSLTYLRGMAKDFPRELVLGTFASYGLSLISPYTGCVTVDVSETGGEFTDVSPALFYELLEKEATIFFIWWWPDGGSADCRITYADDLTEIKIYFGGSDDRQQKILIKCLINVYFQAHHLGKSVGMMANLNYYTETELGIIYDWKKILEGELTVPAYPDLVLVPQHIGEKIFSAYPRYSSKIYMRESEGREVYDDMIIPVRIVRCDRSLLAIAALEQGIRSRSGQLLIADLPWLLEGTKWEHLGSF
jgi:hypothetical protein